MKKLSMIGLTLLLSLSLSSVVMAKGVTTAPGQADNFSKGVTTEVFTTKTVVNSTAVDVQSSSTSSTEAKSLTNTVVGDPIVVITQVQHPVFTDHFREVTTTTTPTTTTTSNWDQTTEVITTTTTETPISTTTTTVTTVQHQGAPGSNGKVLSSTSTSTDDVVRGEPVVTISTNTVVTDGDVTTTSNTTISTTETKSGWHLGQLW